MQRFSAAAQRRRDRRTGTAGRIEEAGLTDIEEDVYGAGVHDEVVIRHHDVIVGLPNALPDAAPLGLRLCHQRPDHLPLHGLGHAQRQRALQGWDGKAKQSKAKQEGAAIVYMPATM